MTHDDAADVPTVESEPPASEPESSALPPNVIPAAYIDPATLTPLQRETWPEKGEL